MGRDVAVRIDEARRVSVARLLVVAVVVRIPLEFPGERHRAVVFALVDGVKMRSRPGAAEDSMVPVLGSARG